MILETMQNYPSSANFVDSMAFSFEVDDMPLDTPTVLGELAAADGMLNTPVSRDAIRFNFAKSDPEVSIAQQTTKLALAGEFATAYCKFLGLPMPDAVGIYSYTPRYTNIDFEIFRLFWYIGF